MCPPSSNTVNKAGVTSADRVRHLSHKSPVIAWDQDTVTPARRWPKIRPSSATSITRKGWAVSGRALPEMISLPPWIRVCSRGSWIIILCWRPLGGFSSVIPCESRIRFIELTSISRPKIFGADHHSPKFGCRADLEVQRHPNSRRIPGYFIVGAYISSEQATIFAVQLDPDYFAIAAGRAAPTHPAEILPSITRPAGRSGCAHPGWVARGIGSPNRCAATTIDACTSGTAVEGGRCRGQSISRARLRAWGRGWRRWKVAIQVW